MRTQELLISKLTSYLAEKLRYHFSDLFVSQAITKAGLLVEKHWQCLNRVFSVYSMCAADVAVVNVGASFSCFVRLRIDLGRPGSSVSYKKTRT